LKWCLVTFLPTEHSMPSGNTRIFSHSRQVLSSYNFA
jgi:hypothetical protein